MCKGPVWALELTKHFRDIKDFLCVVKLHSVKCKILLKSRLQVIFLLSKLSVNYEFNDQYNISHLKHMEYSKNVYK